MALSPGASPSMPGGGTGHKNNLGCGVLSYSLQQIVSTVTTRLTTRGTFKSPASHAIWPRTSAGWTSSKTGYPSSAASGLGRP